uniref:Uncharacterized protein n=1 Tax=viral metagenome TaxID=1070528 RepID=A0A6C0J6S0_9ZZZZ
MTSNIKLCLDKSTNTLTLSLVPIVISLKVKFNFQTVGLVRLYPIDYQIDCNDILFSC